MAPRINTGTRGILISAIVLIISVLLLVDRLLATDPVQFILEDGRAVPVEEASYFSLNDVLFLIITAWLGGMSFLYIVMFSQEKGTPISKEDIAGEQKNESMALLAVNMLEGDEKILLQKIVGNGGILQRELVMSTGFSEPKVSRLLDKLERRGLILRQRDGMGNRILLKNE